MAATAPSVGEAGDLTAARALTPEWTDHDFLELAKGAARNRMNPADEWLVLYSESGGSPKAKNVIEGYPYAVGLPQFTKAANALLGITEEQRIALPSKSVAEQLPLVEKLFTPWAKAGKSYAHAGVVYAANFAPSRMASRGTDYETILYTQKDDPVAYRQNPGFDVAKKGYITIGDLVEHLRDVSGRPGFRAGLVRLRAATGDPSLSPTLPAPPLASKQTATIAAGALGAVALVIGAPFLGAAAVAGGVYWVLRRRRS